MGHGHSLAAFYLFNDVPVPDRALLEALLVRTTHGQGDVIFHEGDEAEAMYALEDGAVEIVKDSGRTVVATLAKGDAFGPSCRPSTKRSPPSSATRRPPWSAVSGKRRPTSPG